MDENVKSAKLNFTAFLNKYLPFIAIAGAALSFIFTFLIGVTVTSGTGSESSSTVHYIYHYFDGDLLKSFAGLKGVYRSATRAAVLFGLIYSIIGILTVSVFAGLTVYGAIRRYVFKKKSRVELYSICTFLSYALFAGLFYSLNYADVSVGDVFLHTDYNVATIVGLALSSVVICVYIVFKTISKKQFFDGKLNKFHFLYSAGFIFLLAVIIALLLSPTVFVNERVEGTFGGETVSVSAGYSFGFIQLIATGAVTSYEEKLSSLVSSASCGFVVLSCIAILYAVLAVRLVIRIFGKSQNDNVLYIVGFASSLVLMFFGAVAGSFFTDLKDLVTLVGADEIISEARTINVAVPITAFVLAVLAFVVSAVYPFIYSRISKKLNKEIAEAREESEDGSTLLEVKNLCKYFVIGRDFLGRPTKTLKAVDNISFKLEKGKTLGIVGESGCGKTTMGRTILRLYDVTSGDVWFKGQKISLLSNRDFDKLRPDMQMIFQDPYASLSPRLTVGEIIGEAVKQHKLVPKSEYHDYVLSVMKMCGLQPHYFERYPHEFSGGQRQRICIARALALKPELVVCDEPVSALDVSIQAQIINMLIELRKTLSLTYIFISHDLSVVKHISDEVGVMYLGSMVEYGSKDNIFENTLHPYTRALFSAVPVPDPHVKMNRIILKGDIPSPVNPPKGCKFHTRCESCMEICGKIAPIYKEVEKGHFCACHLYNTEEETKLLELEYEKRKKLEEETAARAKKGFFESIKEKFAKKPVKDDKDGVDDAAEE